MITDPFSPPQEYGFEAGHREMAKAPHAISLYELNAKVHAVVEQQMKRTYWITAELSEVRTASNGHCYLEFVQKDPMSGALLAKARGVIWRTNYRLLADSFYRSTGRNIGVGINVMVEVCVEFHELYGYSLNVININPAYTLGEMALQRKEIIRMLEEDGVMDLNKELPLPPVLQRVAVISSATAAGYGDFCNQLEQSGLHFEVKLFPAVMQGDRVEKSVIAALDAIAAEEDKWDVVVIIRGGGATTDLNGFDSYLLASNVAQFPLPIFTGIGHERDDTIVDLVAHTRFKTPTAVAAFLIESRQGEMRKLDDLRGRLLQCVQQRINGEQRRLDALRHKLQLQISETLSNQKLQFQSLAHRFEAASGKYLSVQQRMLVRTSSRMELLVQQRIFAERERLRPFLQRIPHAVNTQLTVERHRLEMLSRSVKLAGPERILAMGFTITLKEGRVVTSPRMLRPGDKIVTCFAKGQIRSEVLQKEHKPSTPSATSPDKAAEPS